MASFPILATGQNTGVYLDNSPIRASSERLRSDVLGAEKMKLNKSLQDEQDFLKAMEVDPVALMTQRGIEMQSKAFEQFRDKWANRARATKGRLTMDDKIEMQQDRVAMEGFQQNLAAHQQRYLQDLQEVLAHPDKWDYNDFMQKSASFYATGIYSGGLIPAAKNFDALVDDDLRSYKGGLGKSVTKVRMENGKPIAVSEMGDEQEGRQRVLGLIANDQTGGVIRGLITKFDNLPMSIKKQYLDVNKDNVISDEEWAMAKNTQGMASNPIVKWAMDDYGKRYRIVNEQPTSLSNGDSATGARIAVGGKYIDYSIPESQGNYQLSNTTTAYDYFPVYIDEPINFNLGKSARAVDEYRDEEAVLAGTNVDARIVGYDRATDNVILQPTSGVGSLKNAQTVIVPRADIQAKLPKGIYIRVNGKNVLLGEGKAAVKRGIFDNL